MDIDHTKVFRWVQEYGQELDRRCRPHLRPTNDSWRVDETYIKVKGKDRYLYRAVDSDGNGYVAKTLEGQKNPDVGIEFRQPLQKFQLQTRLVL